MRIARHPSTPPSASLGAGPRRLAPILTLTVLSTLALSEGGSTPQWRIATEQTPDWPLEDISDLLNGSMGSEFVPEDVLRTLVAANPDLFPGGDLSAYGVIQPSLTDDPIGFSRRNVDWLGGARAWGINCMSCHSGTVDLPNAAPLLILGMSGDFNVEAFYGAVFAATFRAATREGIGPFLVALARARDANADEGALESRIAAQREALAKTLADDPFGAKGVAAGELHEIDASSLDPMAEDLTKTVQTLLRLFHNMRVAVHVPEPPQAPAGTPGGPGRNDAFGLLGAALLGKAPSVTAPVKFAHPWNLAGRVWVHWDGNTNDPSVRNILASLGLGCPCDKQGSRLDMRLIDRHTALTERLRSPKYPFAVDAEAAKRGSAHYEKLCASCHEAPEEQRLYSTEELGTDPNRAKLVDEALVNDFGAWIGSLRIEGFTPKAGSVRPTGKYWAVPLDGAWARAPYLHNGSVRTMRELLAKPSDRPKTWKRGSREYDEAAMGFLDGGEFVFDTTLSGNSNAGHAYGVDLSDGDKRDLVEYLKTR